MSIEEYMNQMCVCGHPRREHAHFYTNDMTYEDTLKDTSVPQVLCVTGSCPGFLNEVEMKLKGNPLTNALLGPGIQKKIDGLKTS